MNRTVIPSTGPASSPNRSIPLATAARKSPARYSSGSAENKGPRRPAGSPRAATNSDAWAQHQKCLATDPVTPPTVTTICLGEQKGGRHLSVRTADVVVVGAGVVGAAIAFGLTSRGVRDVVVLDKG